MPTGQYIRSKLSRREKILANIYIDPETGCWLWIGRTNKDGYGMLGHTLAHRASYVEFKGPIPEGLVSDHVCHDPKKCQGGIECPHRRCINPDHVEPCKSSDNTSKERSAHKTDAIRKWTADRAARTTHCPQGHPYSEENTFVKKGMRNCRICHRERNRRH